MTCPEPRRKYLLYRGVGGGGEEKCERYIFVNLGVRNAYLYII